MSPNFYGDEVAHAAAGDEQSGFLAEDFSGASFQGVDGGVFKVDVVADFGFGHGATHSRCWAGDGIAAQVDYVGGALYRVQFSFWIGCGLNWHIFLRGRVIHSVSASIQRKPRSKCLGVWVPDGRYRRRVPISLKIQAAETDLRWQPHTAFVCAQRRFQSAGAGRGTVLLLALGRWKLLPPVAREFCRMQWTARRRQHRECLPIFVDP